MLESRQSAKLVVRRLEADRLRLLRDIGVAMQNLHLPGGPLKLACLAAHPDDIEIAVGATLLALAARGAVEGYWLTLTGSPDRQAEAAAAAQAFLPGAESTFYTFPDGRLPAHWNEVKDILHSFADAVRNVDVVLVPRMDDAHQDHRLLGTMAPTVWRDALVLHYEIPKWDGDLAQPNCYLPISPELGQRKVSLLNEHYLSQRLRDWWDDELFLGLMRIRGMECRSRYAEAFKVSKAVLSIGVEG
jgi:LmbE family N-acetylglucosaminyl deacetylase